VKFKLDENVPFTLKHVIESAGEHEVNSVFHEDLVGIDDKSLNLKCLNEKEILITLDTDFINISDPYYGIVIIRSKTKGKHAVKAFFNRFINNFSLENVVGKIVIVEWNQIRIRT